MSTAHTPTTIESNVASPFGKAKKFLIVALCGVLIAFLGLEVLSLMAGQQTEQRRREIGMAGGRCDTVRKAPSWLQSLAGKDVHTFMDHPVISSLNMTGNRIGDANLAKLPVLDDLVSADLHDSEVTSEGLKTVSRWKAIQKLDLGNTKVTDVTPLAALPQLESLQLNFSQVRQEFLRGLPQLTHLKELGVGYTQVTDQGVVEIAKCTGLEKLSLAASELGEHGLAPLLALEHLNTLVLKDAKFHPEDLQALMTARPDLKVVK